MVNIHSVFDMQSGDQWIHPHLGHCRYYLLLTRYYGPAMPWMCVICVCNLVYTVICNVQ